MFGSLKLFCVSLQRENENLVNFRKNYLFNLLKLGNYDVLKCVLLDFYQ